MAEARGDHKGYYATLRLEPGAGPEAIQRAYRSLEEEWRVDNSLPRFQIQEAYRFLTDPDEKARYDAHREVVQKAHPDMPFWILAGALASLLVFAGFYFPGFLRSADPSFRAGDTLVRNSTQAPVGTVVRLESKHRFPNGVVGKAYLIELPDGERHWYPASDVESHHRVQEPEPAETPAVDEAGTF
jgi:curved DNA-binding protein CbpA